MLRKRLFTLLGIITLFLANPINLLAHDPISFEKDDLMNNELVSEQATGLCHCGGERKESVFIKIETSTCPYHSVRCNSYFAKSYRIYNYCTNTNCGDNWYGDWLVFDHYHEND